ncbi:MAG: response regulator transcription factor [Chloroflexi bacterium]|nr:response regulator transcription factor [Chloroflexota bacterium]
MNGSKITILIVDDHNVVRQGLRALLEAEPDLAIVGEASQGQEALAKCHELQPDLLLTDISMPGLNGLEVAKAVHEESPNIKVILLTMHDEHEYFFQGLAAGASGYVVKGASADELLTAIRAVHGGGTYLQPSLATELVNDYLRTKKAAAYDGLTPREAEILRLIAEGLANKQIAERLVISVTTVQTHRSHLMEKLNLHSQADLFKYAVRKGLLKATS